MIRDELVKEGYRLVEELKQTKPGSKEYRDIMTDLGKVTESIREFDKQEAELGWADQLNEAKLAEINKPIWKRDGFIQAMVGAGCTVGTTAMMLNFEKLGNITSKAIGMIPKPRMK